MSQLRSGLMSVVEEAGIELVVLGLVVLVAVMDERDVAPKRRRDNLIIKNEYRIKFTAF